MASQKKQMASPKKEWDTCEQFHHVMQLSCHVSLHGHVTLNRTVQHYLFRKNKTLRSIMSPFSVTLRTVALRQLLRYLQFNLKWNSHPCVKTITVRWILDTHLFNLGLENSNHVHVLNVTDKTSKIITASPYRVW